MSRQNLRVLLGAVVVVLGLSAAPRAARADGGPFGVGLIIGSPTGVSMKYYLGGSGQAIAAALGGAFAGDSGIHVHADYLWHPVMLTQDDAFNLPLHVGVGVRLLDHDRGKNDNDDFHVGVRAPVGLTFDFTSVPLDVFLEVALILDFQSDDNHDGDTFGLDLNAGVGVRYYF
jgi:hypothetical protein